MNKIEYYIIPNIASSIVIFDLARRGSNYLKYDSSIQEFLRTYVNDIQESNAAIFAGAGLSRSAGYVDWKELLREIAIDLNLDIALETDLVTLAQYHFNKYKRNKINQVLINEFSQSAKPTDNHKILSQLPISTYWTTNYDHLIEDSLTSIGKRIDKKITPDSLSNSVPGSDATVYKMHGDSSLPNEAVLIKDDYESYDQKRKLFSTALQGDLVSKTFLFIGFSFDDPNLSNILGKIRILLTENTRRHYCFMKKINKDDYSKDEEFLYAKIKQELRIEDLQRYGITVLQVDSYADITDILQLVLYLVKRKNIFVSGSASDYGDWGEKKSFEFSTLMSKSFIKNNNNIVSGFGLGIGSCVISGALEEIYLSQDRNVEERLKCRPFPQVTTGQLSISKLWTKYREEMLSSVGISVFIFGNKFDDKTGKIINATGMVEEFDISVSNGVIPIPVGATGFTSNMLWQRVMENFEKYVGIEDLKGLYTELGDKNKSTEELIEIVLKIINHLVRR